MLSGISECDREPIHIPDSIQPHGLLLTLHPSDLSVVQVAGDSHTFLGMSPQQLRSEPLSARLGVAALAKLRSLISQTSTAPRPSLRFQVKVQDTTLDVSAHISGGLIVLELMRRLHPELLEPHEWVHSMTSAIQGALSMNELLDRIAHQVQHASGFDRVMVYRFDRDGSGRVEAESCSSDKIDSYLGLAYPAGDIPQQKRRLYLQNWIRCIPDVDYHGAPIEPPLNPVNGKPLDLTHSALRSVSAMHLQYLRNMGVAASLSLSIIVEGQLWGLIACHHQQPRYLNCGTLSALELFAQLASVQLASSIALHRARLDAFRRDLQEELFAAIKESGFPKGLACIPALLLQLMDSPGVAIHTNDITTLHGRVPSSATLNQIIAWLDSRPHCPVWATDCLSAEGLEVTADGHEVAGVLVLSIPKQPRNYVLWFLPEQRTSLRWAGNPDHAVNAIGAHVSPRQSFAEWREEVRGRSRPWLADELNAAQQLRAAILESALTHIDEVARNQEAARKRQELLMHELDHRVKNILATIQSVVRFSGKAADSLADFSRGLEQRLISMAKAHDLLTTSRWAGASLHRLVKDELAVFATDAGQRFSIYGDDVLLVPSAALSLSLALHELATNAAKYGALSTARGEIVITCERVPGIGAVDLIKLQWAEHNGPRVTTPARKGFGCLLLEKIYENDPRGMGVQLHFDPGGVRCVIWLRADRTLAEDAGSAAEQNMALLQDSPRTNANLNGLKILLVEDNPIVARDVADVIVTAGGDLSGPYPGIDESLAAVASESFDVALLDVDLDGVPVWPLAEVIKARGIPIVLATGFSDAGLWPAEFRAEPTIHKPYDHDRLLRKLRRAVTPHGRLTPK